MPPCRANALMFDGNTALHRVYKEVFGQSHRHVPRVEPSITATTDILVLVAEAPRNGKTQVLGHPAHTADFNRLVAVFIAGIVQRRTVVNFVNAGRVHQAAHREGDRLAQAIAEQVVAIVTQRPEERRRGIFFRRAPESRQRIHPAHGIRKHHAVRESIEAETVFAGHGILRLGPYVTRLQVRSHAHGIIDILDIGVQPVEIVNARDMPAHGANTAMDALHGILRQFAYITVGKLHRSRPRIEAPILRTIFNLAFIAETARHIHIQVFRHPHLITDMDCQDFLVLDFHDFRDHYRWRRRRFLDFVKLVFYATDRSSFVLAGHNLFERPHVVHKAPVIGANSIDFHRRPELDITAHIHKAAVRILNTCRNRIEAKFVGTSRDTHFTFPQVRRLEANADTVTTAHPTDIVLELKPVLVRRHVPALGANIVILALHLAEIELLDGMGIIIAHHPHGHRPIIKPTIP